MRHAMRARGVSDRTAFNLLGPLTNPAGARAQIAGGIFRRGRGKSGKRLAELGVERAFVCTAQAASTKFPCVGETKVAEVAAALCASMKLRPKIRASAARQFPRFPAATPRTMQNSSAHPSRRNRPAARHRHTNAAAAIVAAGRAADFLEGARSRRQSIDSGAARKKLGALIAFTSKRRVCAAS